MLKVTVVFSALLITLCLTGSRLDAAPDTSAPFPGIRSDWNGYDKYDFEVDGRACCVVTPKAAAPGRPWIWRARFWGHEPQTDLALLALGFHVAYMDVADLFGNSEAVAHWDAFYAFLTREHGLAARPALEGMSRGGLIIFNWAAANPDAVACIYADAPVCDIKSWPGGKGKGTGNAEMWPLCLKAYGLTEDEAMAFKGNPIDKLEALACAGIPLLHVCGGADDAVPVAENTAIVEERYRKLEGPIHVIIKEGCGHHPHSLEDPAPIVAFIRRNTCGTDPHIILRDTLDNARIRFEREKKGRVVFLGGSITEMKGWRDMACEGLQKRFPDTEFDFVNAGIASTDSTFGAFRLQEHVFKKGRVDLLFVEFAVNDQHNFRTPNARVRGMEGLIRQARTTNPDIDIVVQYCVDPVKIEYINKGEIPPVIADHEKVAQHYGIPVIHLAGAVTERINAGEFTWETFGGLHPAPFGHRVYARAIERLFDTVWNAPLPENAEVRPHAPLPESLDPLNYARGRFVALAEAELVQGWRHVPQWMPQDKAGKRAQFVNIPVLAAEEPGAELHLRFSGTAVGLLVVAGPDVGILEYQIDGAAPQPVDQFTEWSPGLHIPWAYMLDTELAPGEHDLVLRTAAGKNDKSLGHAARIVQFLVN